MLTLSGFSGSVSICVFLLMAAIANGRVAQAPDAEYHSLSKRSIAPSNAYDYDLTSDEDLDEENMLDATDYDQQLSDFVKRGLGLSHALRIKKSSLGNAHALRIKKSSLGNAHALRIKKSNLGNAHALRIKKSNLGNAHALRIKKSNLGNAHALRIKKDYEDGLADYYYDQGMNQGMEPYIKRQIARSHILRL